MPVMPKVFPDKPLDSAARYGVAHLFADGNSHPGMMTTSRRKYRNKVAVMCRLSDLSQMKKFGSF